MSYLAECTSCITHIKNIRAYANKPITFINDKAFIDVDTEEEVILIKKLNKQFKRTLAIYIDLINVTENIL